MNSTQYFDIVIVGAGPAGSTCALSLANSGLRVAMVDKATFPRDKICGDAIPGLAVKTLQQMNPEYVQALDVMTEKCVTKRSHFWINDEDYIEIKWVNKAYTCARLDFDYQLFRLAQEKTNTQFFQGYALKQVIPHIDFVELQCAPNLTLHAKMVIGCDGAHSVVNKQLTDYKMDLQHYGGAVRAYYAHVEGMQEDCTEIYIQKKHLPGYFWLFPLPDGRANVGLGMHSTHISKYKINLKNAFQEFIDASPILSQKLKNSQLEGKLTGFGLPFGSKKRQVSGHRFVLTGPDGTNMNARLLLRIDGWAHQRQKQEQQTAKRDMWKKHAL
ncbi:MAG: geranylgeranyl reductase family protein, partial [Saprospiraceae bacterium]|nr:geranylgeranyl reductase family protein [Saprospiraceae bacterium]